MRGMPEQLREQAMDRLFLDGGVVIQDDNEILGYLVKIVDQARGYIEGMQMFRLSNV
jgi:hypothetical protein